MKSKWENIKKLYKNKYTKPLLFFGFYIIFFTVIVMAFSSNISTNNINNDVDANNKWENISDNYEYLYEIKTNDNTFTLEGMKYRNKELFTKRLNDTVISEVYAFYESLYIKKDNEWTSIDDFILVDDSFDNRLLNINYLKFVISDAELMNSTTNFDESITDKYSYNNLNIEVVSANKELKTIDINLPHYKVTLQYKNINKVQDFVVEK